MSKKRSFQHIREEKDELPILHTHQSKPNMNGRNGKEEEKKPKNCENSSKSSAPTTPTMTPIDDFTMCAMQTIRSSVCMLDIIRDLVKNCHLNLSPLRTTS